MNIFAIWAYFVRLQIHPQTVIFACHRVTKTYFFSFVKLDTADADDSAVLTIDSRVGQINVHLNDLS